jgi:hypothetical protein
MRLDNDAAKAVEHKKMQTELQKLLFNLKWLFCVLLAVPGVAFAQSPNGSDINQAIPIYFGQTINDTVDKSTRPNLVYSITLAKGQQLTATAITNTQKTWVLCLASPTSVTVDRAQCVANAGNSQGTAISLSFTYQAAASGTYYLIVEAGGSGIAFQLQVTAQGTPIITPNPTLAGCVTGQVDYITYSLQLVAAGLPDEVSIGGTKLCPACTVKPPAYPLLVSKMETAMSLNVGVSACYDAAGNIFQLKLTHP